MKHTFLLIHGAWHGAWCWDQLVEVLAQQGHKALAIDLPGHGASGQKPGWNISMQSYVDAINDAAEKLDGTVHLVGHSMGGTAISCAAEQRPELYASLTYVAAFMLQNGNSLLSASLKMDAPKMSKAVKAPNLLAGYGGVDPQHTQAAFYNQCSDEDVKAANALIGVQPSRPPMTKVRISDGRWGQIPRYYVFCEKDQAVPYDFQRSLEEELPCRKTVTLNTDHSPFISDKQNLSNALLDFAADASAL